jgi:hypothetical protein
MRSNIEGVRMRRTLQEDAETSLMQFGPAAATVTLGPNSPPVISLDPGVAAINVVMYAPGATTFPAQISPMYTIINRAAATGTLVMKQSDGSTTFATIAVGKMGIVAWDGVVWRGSSLP